jgi:hypothetical protein
MDEQEKHTLADALKIARAQSKKEPLPLWAPKLDQPPPVTPCIGQPVPPGVVIVQHAHPDQKPLALRPLDPSPTKAQQNAHAAIWADIGRRAAVANEDKTEATRWGLPFPVPTQAPLPPDLLLLSEAVKELGYQTTRGLMACLRRYKYPPDYRVISRKAIAELLRKKAEKRLESKNNSQKAIRANPLPEPKERAQAEKLTRAK